MAQFVNIYKCDLHKGPVVTSLHQVFLGDVEANRVGVHVTDNGEDVTLTGTCSGTAILCNGGTVALTGTVEGSLAYVDLPSAVYTVEGPVEIYVTLTQGDQTTTLLTAHGNAVRTDSGVVIDPGTIIPSVAALISDIDEAVASIPADYSDLLGTIAPDFSSSTAYTAGQYVWYSGTLYRFTSDHAAGSWTGTDVIAAEIGEDVADLKGALNADEKSIVYDGIIEFENIKLEWEHGIINASYQEASDTRNDFARTIGYFNTEKDTIITIKKQSANAVIVVAYTKSGDVYTGESRTTYNNNATITLNKNKYYRFCITAVNSTDVIDLTNIAEYAIFEISLFQTLGGIKNIGQAQSALGNSGVTIENNSTTPANTMVEITSFPKLIKQQHSFSLFVTFANFAILKVGQGYNVERGRWIEIDTTNVYVKDSERTIGTIAHGINFTGANVLSVTLDIKNNDTALFNLVTNTGIFQHTFTYANEVTGNYFFTSTTNIGRYKFSAISSALKAPLWIFGDSYLSVYDNRISGQLRELGYFDKIMIDAYPGNTSSDEYAELLKCLALATPKIIVWCTGMNDTATSYEAVYNQLNKICNDKNIELILYRIPTVTDRYTDNQAVNTFVTATGKRYVNAYTAVETSDPGVWFSGLLSEDGVHPTIQGAKVLAMRFLVDVPEILQY